MTEDLDRILDEEKPLLVLTVKGGEFQFWNPAEDVSTENYLRYLKTSKEIVIRRKEIGRKIGEEQITLESARSSLQSRLKAVNPVEDGDDATESGKGKGKAKSKASEPEQIAKAAEENARIFIEIEDYRRDAELFTLDSEIASIELVPLYRTYLECVARLAPNVFAKVPFRDIIKAYGEVSTAIENAGKDSEEELEEVEGNEIASTSEAPKTEVDENEPLKTTATISTDMSAA